MLAAAYVRTLLPTAKMSLLELLSLRTVALPYKLPLWHVFLLPISLKWPEFVLAVALIKTPYRSSAATMSLLNKPQKLQSIAVAFALSLSFLLVLTTSFSTPHSSKKLFRKPLKQLKEFQPISSDSCAPTIDISCAHLLAPPF